jgi:hypothetical protein
MARAAKRLYVDTSAYLCILLRESRSAELEAELQGAELVSSSLLPLEAYRNLVRLARQGSLAAEKLTQALERLDVDLELFTLRDLTLDLCRGRSIPILSTPRSLDLAHLRTALWFHEHEPLTRFVTLDAELNSSARELGLPT